MPRARKDVKKGATHQSPSLESSSLSSSNSLFLVRIWNILLLWVIWVSLFPASVFPVCPFSFLFSLPAFLSHGLIEYLLQARPCGR